MGKTRFESSVKQIPYPQQAVYDMLSNLENISKVMDRIPADKIKDISFDRDHVSMSVDPVGAIKLAVCEREEPKCIKFQTEKSPVPFYVWIQMLPVTDTTSKMRITAEADLNPFIKTLVQKPLQDGVEQIADGLAQIQYN
ncbi:MAG: SRPBCC family protein [Prevotella sp.]|nr:SRPBCC family protein [Prevotellaceae bacterium]MDY4628777.1 SRPBCC family protein [Prevotella sp.]MDY5210202.1 SRPBCC family protein [Prevotella sp.]